MKKLLITAVAIIVVAGSVTGAFLRNRKAAAPEVTTLPVSRGDIVQVVGATGTLEAVTTVDVGTQVTGVIKELYADFNSIVRKGQLIAKIDPATIEAQIQQDDAQLLGAEASLERLTVALEDARNKLKRAEDLFKRKLVTQQDLETAQVNARTAEAQIKGQRASITQMKATRRQHQVSLTYTDIYAPINGIVINRKVDVGQTVVSNNAATSMFQIAQDLTKMQLKATIDESDVGLLRPGQVARFRVDAYPATDFTGRVVQVRLQPTVSQNVVTYTTIVSVANENLELKPGMTANVTIEITRRENVLRVPVPALRFRPTSEIFEALGVAEPADLRARPPVQQTPDVLPASLETRLDSTRRNATTIDGLFGELRVEPVPGRVWTYSDGSGGARSLKAIDVHTGISDGTWAELLDGSQLPEGRVLVSNVDTGRPNVVRPSTSPLMPGRPGGDHGGGHGGPH